jgi:hypothetical protein
MEPTPVSLAEVESATRKLMAYCRASNWAGYDPYDALNSPIFQTVPLLNRYLPRLFLTQFLKRFPFNFRSLLSIPKVQNPKGSALMLAAVLKVPELVENADDALDSLVDAIVAQRYPESPYWCWGYSFAWQTRTILVPRGYPSLVCTTFVANALLNLYDRRPQPRLLEMAVSAAEYILNDLYWSASATEAGFSYPLPQVNKHVYNANFLASALLCRIYRLTGESKFVEPALKAARYSAGLQHDDGSWAYGAATTQQWVDNFHTGFNLFALQEIDHYLRTDEFEPAIRRGYAFYKAHFFRSDGAPRYYHDRTYPIDAHSVALSILTPLGFRRLDPDGEALAQSVFRWVMRHMWDERGFFCYRVLRAGTIRISYMRWTQAWMLLAIATLCREMQAPALPAGPEGVCQSLL